MTTPNLDTATKTELRILCKAAGIAYGKLDNAGMRAALKAHAARSDEPRNPVSKKAAQLRAAKAASKESGEPSIREWLEARLAKGELKVADALAFAEQTQRSKVTVYRQARELGYSARKGSFVKTAH